MLRVANLPDQTNQTSPRAVLYCPACHSTYSAHRWDYFAAAPTTPLRCSHCEESGEYRIAPALRLVRFSTQIEVLA